MKILYCNVYGRGFVDFFGILYSGPGSPKIYSSPNILVYAGEVTFYDNLIVNRLRRVLHKIIL